MCSLVTQYLSLTLQLILKYLIKEVELFQVKKVKLNCSLYERKCITLTSKKNNTCGHPYQKHYAKGMCPKCYRTKGRNKPAWLCKHDKLYAKGLCQPCYISKYCKLYRRK